MVSIKYFIQWQTPIRPAKFIFPPKMCYRWTSQLKMQNSKCFNIQNIQSTNMMPPEANFLQISYQALCMRCIWHINKSRCSQDWFLVRASLLGLQMAIYLLWALPWSSSVTLHANCLILSPQGHNSPWIGDPPHNLTLLTAHSSQQSHLLIYSTKSFNTILLVERGVHIISTLKSL